MSKAARNPAPPNGFRCQADVLPLSVERDLVARIQELPLKEFEFHGYISKRRVVSYGWYYDFGKQTLRPMDEIPRPCSRAASAPPPSQTWRPETYLTR